MKSCDVVHHVAGLDPSNLENAYERLDKVEGSEVYGAPGGNVEGELSWGVEQSARCAACRYTLWVHPNQRAVATPRVPVADQSAFLGAEPMGSRRRQQARDDRVIPGR